MSDQFRPVNRRRGLFAAAIALSLTVGVAAQQPPAIPGGKPQPAPAAAASSATAPAVPAPAAPSAATPAGSGTPAVAAAPAGAPPAPAYSYSPEGRRDPFISLAGRGSDGKPTGTRPAGIAGLLINEVGIKGIVRDHSGFIAMVQGPDNRTYVIRAGDRLMDGTVKAIVQDAVVFSQDVNDPLSLVKQKEIRKNMRSPEGGRG
jgi:hypothetical protein